MASGDEIDLSPPWNPLSFAIQTAGQPGKSLQSKTDHRPPVFFLCGLKRDEVATCPRVARWKFDQEKSPSSIRRERQRRNEFLRRKDPSQLPLSWTIPPPVTSPCSMRSGGNPGHPRHRSEEQEQQRQTQQRQCTRRWQRGEFRQWNSQGRKADGWGSRN